MNIAERITTALTSIINLYCEVAETDTTPYAVYSLEYSEARTKDGPYKYTADVIIAIVGSNYDEADGKSTSVMAAIEALRSSDLSIKLENHSEVCDNNEWVMTSRYTIIQLI